MKSCAEGAGDRILKAALIESRVLEADRKQRRLRVEAARQSGDRGRIDAAADISSDGNIRSQSQPAGIG